MPAVKTQAPNALGMSVQYLVSEGRQIVFQTHVDLNADKEAVDALLDRCFAAADRQKARYDVDYWDDEIRKQTILLDNAKTDIARVTRDHEVRVMGIKAEIEAYGENLEKVTGEDQAQHAASGRKGPWQPSINAKNQVTAMTNKVKDRQQQLQTMTAERDKALDDCAVIVQRHAEHLENMVRSRDKAAALLA